MIEAWGNFRQILQEAVYAQLGKAFNREDGKEKPQRTQRNLR
jgi:hypothetical protein